MSNFNQTYYHDFYRDTVSTTEHMSNTRQSLYNHDFLSEEENRLMLYAIHILYQKIVALGNQIEQYENIDNIDF